MAYKQRISTRGFSMLSALFLWWPFLLPRRHLFGKHFSVSVSSIRKPNIARATDVYFIIFFLYSYKPALLFKLEMQDVKFVCRERREQDSLRAISYPDLFRPQEIWVRDYGTGKMSSQCFLVRQKVRCSKMQQVYSRIYQRYSLTPVRQF